MRWGSLLSTLVLTAASVTLPRMLFSSIGLDREGLESIASTAKLAAGQGGEDRVLSQLKGLQSGEVEGVSLEQLAAVQDAVKSMQDSGALAGASKNLELGAALHEAMKKQRPVGEQMRSGVLRDAERLRTIYRDARPNVLLALISLGCACILVAILGAFPFARPLSRFVLTFVFSLASRWMMLLSLGTAAFFYVAELNAWPLLPSEAVAAPAAYMLLCGAIIRFLDPNYPLWNGLLKGFGAPLLACAAIVGGQFMDPGPPPK